MLLAPLLIIYAVVGLVVATATLRATHSSSRFGDALLAVFFWPLVLPPMLTTATPCAAPTPRGAYPGAGPRVGAVAAARAKLDVALAAARGGEALELAPVLVHIPEVLPMLERRARDLDAMAVLVTEDAPDGEARRRLEALFLRRSSELERALEQLGELVAMIHLARFALPGDGPSIIVPIAATVETLSELAATGGEW